MIAYFETELSHMITIEIKMGRDVAGRQIRHEFSGAGVTDAGSNVSMSGVPRFKGNSPEL